MQDATKIYRNEYEAFEAEASKLVSEITAKYKWDPAYILEIAAMLAEDVNYHEVASAIRNA